MATNMQTAPVPVLLDNGLIDATLKRKSETAAERLPVKLNHTELYDSQDEEDGTPKKPGRKPINTDLPNNASNSDKRRAQNRAAQRAFRDRKDKYVKELEERIELLETMSTGVKDSEASNQLRKENEQLRDLVKKLTTENRSLKEIQFTFQPPVMADTTQMNKYQQQQQQQQPPQHQQQHNRSISTSNSAMYAQQVGHPSPVSPLEQLSHLQTPPEVSNDDNNIYGTSEISDADTIALQQMLQAAAAAMSAAKDATSLSMVNSQSLASASTTAATTHSIPATPTLTTLSSSSPAAATSVANVSAAALQLLASQSQASSQSANALLAGAYATPDTASSMLSNDPFGQGANSPATALAMQELLASQLFPPLAPASTSSAAQSPCLSQPSQMTSPFVAFSSPDIFNTDTLALFGQNINNPLFTDYRDTSSLSALLSEPVEAPVPGANGQPLVFDDTANSLPSAAIVPLEGLTGMESPVNLNDTTQHHVAASVADERKLEEYCASGVLSEDDLDFLCSEMKTKCRAAKEAAVAKLEQLKREHAEQEKRVAHALLMSTQLDAINSTTTPPLP